MTAFCRQLQTDSNSLPYSLRVLLENALRHNDLQSADRIVNRLVGETITFQPARVLMQDLLGIAVMVDLSSMRDSAAAKGIDPQSINPCIPVDLIIDHSLIPVHVASDDSRARNEAIEIARNEERFRFLRWCQSSFSNVRVVPPGKGIMHQINIEYLASGYCVDEDADLLYPDTVYGTDSHTPMVNGLGVVGWGVGGLEAEMAMLGRGSSFPLPPVVGIKLTGRLKQTITATDLVLTITERLRKVGVVGKFVEFCGDSLDSLTAADRCTIANMAPEYGATCVYFPIDQQSLSYLSLSGRSKAHCALVEQAARAQGLWRDSASSMAEFEEALEIDLGEIVPSIAGPRRPQDRVALTDAGSNLAKEFDIPANARRHPVAGTDFDLGDGDVVIAAITSCTNTSNPSVVIGASLLARNAVRQGLSVKPWVKTSFAPGSQVVAEYLKNADLQRYLDALGFNVVGFGCTTCNGASGPIAEPVQSTIETHALTCAAALSGNRNFEGRIHPNCRANYIMSPPLVVAYALAGSMQIDFETDPIGRDADGEAVYLRDIWPDDAEISACIERCVKTDLFSVSYANILQGSDAWNALGDDAGTTYDWQSDSTYLKSAPYLNDVTETPELPVNLHGLRPLVLLGDSITTDHISPSGAILADSAAGEYLEARATVPAEFNTYGTRRGNHEIAMRSTFANNRLRNEMLDGVEGSFTRLMPDDRQMRVFDAAMEYQARGESMIIIAGREYGCGSSRDTAAKCVNLVGVRAIIAESYERIHRSNLIGMGILPLEFINGVNRRSLELTGAETFDINDIDAGLTQRCELTLVIHYPDGRTHSTPVLARLDTADDAEYVTHGGILPFVFRQMAFAQT